MLKIHIPKHFLKVPILNQLNILCESYEQPEEEDIPEKDIDPVHALVSYCYKDLGTISYLTSLFYSLKGTKSIIGKIEKYFKNYIDKIEYSAGSESGILRINFKLSEEASKGEDFDRMFREFCNTLLYFGDSSISTLELVIKVSIESRFQTESCGTKALNCTIIEKEYADENTEGM